MTKQPLEEDFRKDFIKQYTGWIERIEPGLGMNPGIPDLIAMTDIGLVWIELKVGSLVENVLYTEEIRPAQVSWHFRFHNKNKGRCPVTLVATGVWTGKSWRVFVIEGDKIMNWEEGFETHNLKELRFQELTEDLETFVSGCV